MTIQTGLSKIEQLIIYAPVTEVKSYGICSLVYNGSKAYATGASYGSYSSSITFDVGTVSVSGGNMTYTPLSDKRYTRTLEDVTYNWIAIGS